MRRKRRTHSAEFKAKVALAAIQGDLTLAELVKKFDVHANQVSAWKKQLLSGAPDVFGKGAKKQGKRPRIDTFFQNTISHRLSPVPPQRRRMPWPRPTVLTASP
ncbi:transposase, partial [Thiolapillus sp.]|uniref:transposase n=1 Tax=Thiolapillus sp. TaxID=2017437 RepID=UPI003AF7018C